jgi:Holliday junction resolvase-like predicted endonuclease
VKADRRPRGVAAGNRRELRVSDYLREQGWCVGARRHLAGPGDLLAVHPDGRVWLVEVKSTAGGPYERFDPADRAAIRVEAARIRGVAVLVWWPPRKDLTFLFPDAWPAAANRA